MSCSVLICFYQSRRTYSRLQTPSVENNPQGNTDDCFGVRKNLYVLSQEPTLWIDQPQIPNALPHGVQGCPTSHWALRVLEMQTASRGALLARGGLTNLQQFSDTAPKMVCPDLCPRCPKRVCSRQVGRAHGLCSREKRIIPQLSKERRGRAGDQLRCQADLSLLSPSLLPCPRMGNLQLILHTKFLLGNKASSLLLTERKQPQQGMSMNEYTFQLTDTSLNFDFTSQEPNFIVTKCSILQKFCRGKQ